MPYYSERQRGPKPRTEETITAALWKNLVLVLEWFMTAHYFAKSFPKGCPDNGQPVGTDTVRFRDAIEAEIPGLKWPLSDTVPDGFLSLDIVEFCFNYSAQPIEDGHHPFFDHYHLRFDVNAGRTEFVTAINEVFARHGSVYQLKDDGQVIRLTTAVLQETLASALFATGDAELDRMLETARSKFFNPDLSIRKEALELLWDAFERVKTVEAGKDKKAQIAALIDKASTEPMFRKILDDEGNALTWIGNHFMIRHKETSKIPITESEHVDYLFHRMFAFIRLMLRMSGRGG
jgi:hypothetical protein